MAEEEEEGAGFKSSLPAGGGSITLERPHPFQPVGLWTSPLILTGVLSTSSGEIKTVNVSENMILLITDE